MQSHHKQTMAMVPPLESDAWRLIQSLYERLRQEETEAQVYCFQQNSVLPFLTSIDHGFGFWFVNSSPNIYQSLVFSLLPAAHFISAFWGLQKWKKFLTHVILEQAVEVGRGQLQNKGRYPGDVGFYSATYSFKPVLTSMAVLGKEDWLLCLRH